MNIDPTPKAGRKMPRIACFCMPEHGHVTPLSVITSDLISAGVEVHVLCESRFRSSFDIPDHHFHDLFKNHPLDRADAHSTHKPCRYVSYAGYYAESIISLARELAPDLILHDIFAVIAVPVANALALPRVCVTSGHNHAPEAAVTSLQQNPRIFIDAACHRAVEQLRKVYGMPDASPFSHITCLSKELNVLPEPREFLQPEETAPFEPCAFFGTLHTELLADLPRTLQTRARVIQERERRRLLFVSFGTVAWEYHSSAAIALLSSLGELCESRDDLDVLVTLGGYSLPADITLSPRLQIEKFVDQWQALQRADWFLSHHGLNSTHEAIALGVPMLSYPFLADQPRLAARCQNLGLAVPLSDELRGAVSLKQLEHALETLEANRETMAQRLSQAREWQQRAAAERPDVIERILSLSRHPASPSPEAR